MLMQLIQTRPNKWRIYLAGPKVLFNVQCNTTASEVCCGVDGERQQLVSAESAALRGAVLMVEIVRGTDAMKDIVVR